MELSGGRHYLDLTDDVDNGVTPQYKSCNCKLNGGGALYTTYHNIGLSAKTNGSVVNEQS